MLLLAAIESDDPVLYFENKVLYKESGEVPDLGKKNPIRSGKPRSGGKAGMLPSCPTPSA
jgi:pyruvate dehydrogenase E1 component beta subunit